MIKINYCIYPTSLFGKISYNDYKDRESHGYWSKKTYWKERSK